MRYIDTSPTPLLEGDDISFFIVTLLSVFFMTYLYICQVYNITDFGITIWNLFPIPFYGIIFLFILIPRDLAH